MTKRIAVILNLALLCLLSYFLFEKGMPNKGESVLVLLAFFAPAASLVALYQNPGQRNAGLFSLYLERKRLEEQQRIEQLKSNSKNA